MENELNETKKSLQRLRKVLDETPQLSEEEKTILKNKKREKPKPHQDPPNVDDFEF